MKTVVFTAQAARDFDGLPLASRLAFEKAVSRFITTGEATLQSWQDARPIAYGLEITG